MVIAVADRAGKGGGRGGLTRVTATCRHSTARVEAVATREVGPLVGEGRGRAETGLMCGSGGARTHGTPMRAVTGLISLQADGTDLIQRRGCRGEGTLEGAKEERNHRKGKGSSGPKGCRAEAEWAWGR